MSLEALQTFCRSEGLRVPEKAEILERPECTERSGRSEYIERSIDAQCGLDTLARHSLARVMEQQSQYFDRFLKEELTPLVERITERVVDQVIERLEKRLTVQRTGPHEHSIECATPAISDHKAAILTTLRVMQAEGLSLWAMANRLNAEGVPTLSGKGQWQQGTIGKLITQTKGERLPTRAAGETVGTAMAQRGRITSKVRRVWIVNRTACSWKAHMIFLAFVNSLM